MEENDANESNDSKEGIMCNPSLPAELRDEEIEIMKGDAIGDTLYSARFVLGALIKMTKEFEFDDTFEKDLCTLWDMTIERDVVLFLLEHDSLNLVTKVIQETSNNRLIEILLGVVGNASCIEETRDFLSNNKTIMRIILETINIADPLILIQLMRFLHSALVFENSGDEVIWFQHFIEMPEFIDKLSFILSSSVNSALLETAFEALIALCSKFVVLEMEPKIAHLFIDMFVKPELISGVVEAFKQMAPKQTDDKNDETTLPTAKEQKVYNYFLEINCILTQYGSRSVDTYEPFIEEILNCLCILSNPLTKKIYLIPLSQNYQGVIENITEILSALNEPLMNELFLNLYKIWCFVEEEVIKLKQENEGLWEKLTETASNCSNCSEDETSCGVNICTIIHEYFGRTLNSISEEALEQCLKTFFTSDMVINLISKLTIDSEEDQKSKLRLCHDKIWNVTQQ